MKKIMIANGEYIKDGQTKTSWKQIGVIMTSQNGKEYCLLDPTINLAGFKLEEGKGMLMCGIFEDTPEQQQSQYRNTVLNTSIQAEAEDDSLPF